MSTYQPPGGPPQGPSGYVPPQDPWALPEHGGLASMPTDPIPQPYQQQPQYATGSDVWSQATVQHGGQLGPMGQPIPAEPPRSRAGLLAIIFLAVLVLGGGGGYATYYFVKQHGATTSTTQTDFQNIQLGQCLVNGGTGADPDMKLSACTVPNSFKAVKVVRGDAVPRDTTTGEVDPKAAAATVCAGLKWDNYYAYWDTSAPAHNVLICLASNASTPATGS